VSPALAYQPNAVLMLLRMLGVHVVGLSGSAYFFCSLISICPSPIDQSDQHTPQVQEPGAQPQFAHEQEEFPQPPIVMFRLILSLRFANCSGLGVKSGLEGLRRLCCVCLDYSDPLPEEQPTAPYIHPRSKLRVLCVRIKLWTNGGSGFQRRGMVGGVWLRREARDATFVRWPRKARKGRSCNWWAREPRTKKPQKVWASFARSLLVGKVYPP